MNKDEARSIYRQKRDALPLHERQKLDDLLLIQFQKLDLPFLQTILSYRSIEENNDPDTSNVTAFLEFRNPALKIAYPRVDLKTISMRAVMTDADTPFQK